MDMGNCVFCQILAGELPASFIYQDELCSVFLDIQPVNPGHMLVISNTHAASLADLDPIVGGQIFKTAQCMAGMLRDSEIHCEGVNLFLADGEAAFQDVFHVHLHVIPRFRGDGFGLKFGPAYFQRPSRDELDDIAARIIDPAGK